VNIDHTAQRSTLEDDFDSVQGELYFLRTDPHCTPDPCVVNWGSTTFTLTDFQVGSTSTHLHVAVPVSDRGYDVVAVLDLTWTVTGWNRTTDTWHEYGTTPQTLEILEHVLSERGQATASGTVTVGNWTAAAGTAESASVERVKVIEMHVYPGAPSE
jgi:hypothetical protein